MESEWVTIDRGIATAWRWGVRVGQWEAGLLECAAAGVNIPMCSCGSVECQRGLAYYWGEMWSSEKLRGLAYQRIDHV